MTATSPVAERPWFPPGYASASGDVGLATDAELADRSWEPVRARLEQARNYWVSTAGPDGRPHARPYWGYWIDDTLYFQVQAITQTRRNLAANPRATMHLESGDEVVVVEGAVEEMGSPSTLDPALVERVLDVMDAKYGRRPSPEEIGEVQVVVFRLRPRLAYTWTLAEFPRSVSRWRLAD